MTWTQYRIESAGSDQKSAERNKKGSRRARLNGWRHTAPNPLSAHLFFGAKAGALRRQRIVEPPTAIGIRLAPGWF